jgi:primosomal protein N' (replication factor Y)
MKDDQYLDMSQQAGSRGGVLLQVALALPLFELFTYRARDGESVPVGAQVVVPFGRRRVAGFVVGYEQVGRVPHKEIREVLDVTSEGSALDAAVLELCRWASSYYLAPLGEVLCAALPSGERVAPRKRIRLSDAGKALARSPNSSSLASLALDEKDRAFLSRLHKAHSLAYTGLTRGSAAQESRLAFLIERGFVVVEESVRGVKRIRTRRADESGQLPVFEAEQPLELNAHQQAALTALTTALDGGYATYVLQGITGSGKTEVYLQLIAEARRRGRGALVLVPEIALTPQLAARFRRRFGDDVAVLHSGLPEAERTSAWRRLRRGEVGIALGARSAIFAPVHDLAVVVVDEEHDGSFKQEEGFRYHARDLAVMRASQSKAVAILGSATPSLETYHNVELGRFLRLLLPTRANPLAAQRPLPPVEVIDLRRHPPGPDGLLSPPLAQAVQDTVARGEQTILFLNRRGFSTFVHCAACGHVLRCSSCAVSLTLHRSRGRMLCHYCGRSEPLGDTCPQCKTPNLQGSGTGTERVETLVRERFPEARVARLDRDTADGKLGRLEEILSKVHRGETDILVGTQMVTKGHDFGGVTLVGILQPDQGIHLPDFRAAERAFQVMEQVSGRSGRGERAGRIVVQTYAPDHPAIASLRTHDYEGFVRSELASRKDAKYPPFARMVVLRVDGRDLERVREGARLAADRARAIADASVRVLGPAEAPIAMLRGRSRFQVWLSSADRGKLLGVTREMQRLSLPHGVRLEVDVDPQSVL